MSHWTAREAEAHLLTRERFGMRFGVERMHQLLTTLDSPQRRFRSVHVVGTNGKSSTARFIETMLAAHGVRTGAYLSPHLTTFAERVRLDGAQLPADRFARAVERAANAAALVEQAADASVTQFELLTAAAFDVFARGGVEIAAVEAGLGGRFDATNVIAAEVVVLTNVGEDHQRWLGPTLEDIAREKLAVVRPGATLITGQLDAGVRRLATMTQADVVTVTGELDLPLPAYQRRNAAVAAAAVEAILGSADPATIDRAAKHVAVPGRFDVVDEQPLTILDGAHNPAGVTAFAAALGEIAAGRRIVACISILDDKDAAQMLRTLLPLCAQVVFTAVRGQRGLPPGTLASLAGQLAGSCEVAIEPDPHRALERARSLAGAQGLVIATGSLQLVGELLGSADRTGDAWRRSVAKEGHRT